MNGKGKPSFALANRGTNRIQVVVKAFLVVSVTTFNLAVMPRSSRTNSFVRNAKIVEKNIEIMHSLGLLCIAKLTTVIRLYCFGGKDGAETGGSFVKINGELFFCMWK